MCINGKLVVKYRAYQRKGPGGRRQANAPRPQTRKGVPVTDITSVPPPTEEANAELLAACERALRWFCDFEEHAPEGLMFGGEATIKRRLREAIRNAKAGRA